MENTVQPGRYRHFKGGEYEVLFSAIDSETQQETVVYRPLYGEGKIWARPAAMWNETVERDGKTFRRFERLEPESDLSALRQEINEIDAQMAALFCRRMQAVHKVAEYKKENGLAVLDAAREKEVLEKNTALLSDSAYAPYYTALMQRMMELSREYQSRTLSQEDVSSESGE